MRHKAILIGISCFLLSLAGCAAPVPVPAPVAVVPQLQEPAAPRPTPPQVNATPADSLTPAQRALLAALPSRGPAPELHNEAWLNSPPLHLAELRGQVVLLDMWTFG